MKKLLVVAAAAFAALVTSSAFADVYLVETNPNAEYPYDSWEKAAENIADAFSALGDGQTLHIGDGTYALTSGFTVNAGKVVISENGPDKTIFQASAQLTSAMSVTGAGSLLAGVTIKDVKFGGNNWDGMTLSSGGTISNCVFLANAHGNASGALNQTGGLTVDCTFRNTKCTGGGTIAAAAAVSGGVMERCRVLDATSTMGSYGAIYVSGSGVVRHTVVARSSTLGCGGIRLDGGTVSNCTVVANETTTKNGNAGIYISKTTAKVVNTICVGNYDKYGTIRPVNGVSGFEACLVNCFTDETVDPRFQAPHDDDYSLLPDSPCIGADGVACGAYPLVLPSGNGAAIFRELVGDWRFDPQTNKLSAVITPDGATCDPETCYWTFDGTEPSEANHAAVGLTVTNAFGLGAATVKFRATVNGESVAVDKTDWFTVKNGYVYVVKNNPNAQAPYDTWETAAATYDAGFAALQEHMVMVIGEGSYQCINNATGLVPPRFSTIRSANGPDTVKFTRYNGNVARIFSLSKYGARVEGLTFDGCCGTGGGPLDLSTSATIANCVFLNATGANIWAPQLVMTAGTVVGCKFKNISGTAGKFTTGGVAVKATGSAVVDRCAFDGVTFTSSTAGDGLGAVSVSGGASVRNSFFINNYLPVYSAIYVGADGHAENCTVVRNQSRVNRADNAATSAVYAADPSASIVNVLTVANTDASGSVIANTAAAEGAEGCFTTCHEADSVQDGDVKFTDPTVGDYSLQPKSVCVNAGTELDWMDDALDLVGNPRIARGVPDIGAYEYTPSTEIGATLSHVAVDGRRFAPQLTEFAAEISPEGAECDPETCYWTFDGREPTAQDHDAVGLAVTNTVGIGLVTVKFRATVNGQAVAADEENWYKVKSEFVYLDKTSTNPEPPYEKWETAAKTLTDAFPYLEEGMTILVADGSYPGSTATLTPPPRASVRSVNGPGKTTITSTGSNHGKVFTLTQTGSRIEGVTFTGSHTDGGPIDMSDVSSVISNCVFNNSTASQSWKTIVSATGGTIVDCVFTNCFGGGANGNNNLGIAVTASGNTVIDRCVFANNSNAGTTRSVTGMGAVRVSGGASVRNSLFKDNKAPFCSAIWVGANGHAENCTLVRNMTNLAKADDANIGAVYAADATASIVNVLTVANTDSSGSTIANTAAAEGAEGCFTTCHEADSILDTGVLFTDPATGDYSIKAKSVCVNAGTELDWMDGALDLAGNPRIAKGVPDIGAYEYTPSTAIGATLSHTVLDGRQFAPQLTEFAAEVTPEDAEVDPTTCYWTFDGREPTAQDHDAVGLAVTNTVGIGMVTVRFRATVNGQAVAVDEENWYRAKGEFVYLDKTSTNPEPPYEKWETAAKSLEEASASLEEGMTLLVADGTYTKTNRAVTCVLPQNATVRSVNGPGAVCFRGMSDGSVVFELSNTGSRLEGLGFTFRHTSGGPVKMSATSAVVSNCVFTDVGSMPWGPMAVLTGGTMVDCVFTNCTCTTGGWTFNAFGNALSASGANTLVDRCVFAGNRWSGGASKTKALGTVWVSDGATVRNSLFSDDCGQFCSAIYVGKNGHAENCTVVGCQASQTNSVDSDVGAVFAADATASVVNVLTTGNTDGEDAAADASGEESAFTTCFIGGDAKFKNAEKSDFRIRPSSPCVGAGTVQPWMDEAADLAGKPRTAYDGTVDIGCYQANHNGLLLIVR